MYTEQNEYKQTSFNSDIVECKYEKDKKILLNKIRFNSDIVECK